jgi:hypothetical protein
MEDRRMNRYAFVLLPTIFLVTVSAATRVAAADAEYVVVKCTDLAEVTTYEVMSPAGLRELQAEIGEEMQYHVKALTLAREEWDADETTDGKFPTGAIARREARQVGMTYDEEEKAQDKAGRLSEREAEKIARDEDREKARRRARYSGDQYDGRRRQKTRELKNQDAARKASEERARKLYAAKLAELMAPAPAGGAQDAPPP